MPLEAEALTELRGELLAASSIGASLDESDQAAPEALTAGDLVLDISGDVDAALIDAFMNDSPPQAAEVTVSLTGWIAAPAQSDLLLNAKRAAHTLKGSANILGIRGVAKLAHRLEDVLEICEADAVAPSEHRARALMAAADCLAQMVAAVAGEDSPPDNAMAVIDLLDEARDNNFAADEAAAPAPRIEAAPLTAAAPMTARTTEARAMTRVPTQLLDDLVRMVGEITIKIGELDQELKSASNHSRELIERDRAIQKRLFELENSVDIRGVAARHKLHAVSAATSGFDSLELDQYNEVQSLTRALIEESTDARDLGHRPEGRTRRPRRHRAPAAAPAARAVAPDFPDPHGAGRDHRAAPAAQRAPDGSRHAQAGESGGRGPGDPGRRRSAESVDRSAAAHPAQRGRPWPGRSPMNAPRVASRPPAPSR